MPKKRNSGDGALYYLPSRKLWRGVADNGFWPNGKRRQEYVHAKTQAAARVKLERMKDEIRTLGSTLDRTTSVTLWSEKWLTTICKPTLKPNSLRTNESITRTWIVPALGTKKVATLKPADVRQVLKNVADAGRKSGTQRKVYDVLSSMLDAARMDGVCARNVADDVPPPKVLTEARGALSTPNALAVLEAAARVEDGTRWWVALLAGLRQSERCGARIESLDLANGGLTVEWALEEITSEHGCGERHNGAWPCGMKRAGSCSERRLKIPDGFDYIPLHGRLALIRPKSGHPRYVPLVPQVVEALRRYLEATKDRPNPYGLIWRKDDGEPHLPGEDGQAWRDILYTAGLINQEQTKEPKDRAEGTEDIPTTHWARHTTATVLMELGVDTKVIGEIVGHVDVKTTRTYQHVSSDLARAASDALGEHFKLALDSSFPPSIVSPPEQG